MFNRVKQYIAASLLAIKGSMAPSASVKLLDVGPGLHVIPYPGRFSGVARMKREAKKRRNKKRGGRRA